MAKLEQTKLLRADETAFLRQLTNTRIRNMVEGSMPLMIMHRMPPPYAGRTYGSVDRLEQRIDLLVDLRSKGQLSGLEYARAMADVKREAVTYCVLYELGREGYALRASTIDTTDGEALLAEIERRFPDADTDAGTEASHYRQVAARAKALLPAVRALVVELER